MQAPGGPDEDPTGGFTLGGWAVNYFDEEMMEQVAESDPYELLLGRGTYEIFAAHWPYDEGPIAEPAQRHPQARRLERRWGSVEWNNSTLISGDVAGYVAELKRQDGPEIQVHGSPGLIQTLLEHDLIDEYRLWIFPVVVGAGKRFFGEGVVPGALRLMQEPDLLDGCRDQHLPASGEHRGRRYRVRAAERGGARAAPEARRLQRQISLATASSAASKSVPGRPPIPGETAPASW